VAPASPAIGPALRRRARTFGFAFDGLRWLVRTQPNFRIHLLVTALVLAAALALRVPPEALGLLALTIGVVLALEALNTALEALCDVASPSYHPLVRVSKDASAAAVLIGAMAAVVVGLAVLGPRLLALVRS
jgi:diacylglycerol kinase (ATP)